MGDAHIYIHIRPDSAKILKWECFAAWVGRDPTAPLRNLAIKIRIRFETRIRYDLFCLLNKIMEGGSVVLLYVRRPLTSIHPSIHTKK